MFTPSTFERIRVDDFTISPFTVHKEFYVHKSEASQSGYTVRVGQYSKKPFPVGHNTAYVNNAPTSSDGTYNYINWRGINHLYYSNPYDVIEGLEGYNSNITEKTLYLTASIISAPFNDIGEGFKPGTVTLSGSQIFLQDDGNNNLYDSSIDTAHFINSAELNAYWGFQNLYRKTLYGRGAISTVNFLYQSNTHGENLTSTATNVTVSPGVEVGGVATGARVEFKSSPSNIFTRHTKELNYEIEENFCISFWLKVPTSQSFTATTVNTIINKRSYADFSSLGAVEEMNDNTNVKYRRTSLQTNTEKKPIDIFPYHFEIYNQTAGSDTGKIRFVRSDGSSVRVLQSQTTLNDNLDHHICTVKSGSMLLLYVDGVLESSGSDVPFQPTNDYHLIFGAEDLQGDRQFSGSIDEVRFYNTLATSQQISSSLAEKTQGKLYQSRNVGNVYYKRGEVVITSLLPKYHDLIQGNTWELYFKNNYTIYEYETLVRIKAGNYNKTMNPTAVKSPKSNLYLDDFTSGSLLPYATTVGLYNDKLQLVAVGKLGRPLKMREDVDLNVIVRWDY